MPRSSLFISIISVILGFAGGFLIANALNRSEINRLQGESERLRTASTETTPRQSEVNLSAEEIRAKIAEADQNPDNFQFQRDLGLALYRYAAMKKDFDLLNDSIIILERASNLNRADADLLVSLGHAHFVVAYFAKKSGEFEKARQYYQKVIAIRPDDFDTRTEIGLTFFLQEPPDLKAAIKEFETSLRGNPKHQKTLQFLTQALWKDSRSDEAAKYLEQLRQVDPKNPAIPDLNSLLTQPVPAKQQ